MSVMSFSVGSPILILGIVLLLWTIFGKLQLPKWEKAVILVFLVLSLVGLVIYLLPLGRAAVS